MVSIPRRSRRQEMPLCRISWRYFPPAFTPLKRTTMMMILMIMPLNGLVTALLVEEEEWDAWITPTAMSNSQSVT